MLLATLGALALAAQQDPSADFFQKMEGEWTVRGTFGDKQEIHGTEVVEKRMDGRWLVLEHRLDYGGKPYRGFCLMTFDPEKKTYTGTWMDESSPKPGAFQGTAEGRTLSFRTTGDSTETRGYHVVRWVFENSGDDGRVVRVFGCEKGSDEEKQIAELHYTRRTVAK